MKNMLRKPLLMILGGALIAPGVLLAQPDQKEKSKDKEKKDKEEIVIVRKGDKNEKVVVEVNGDKITVNGTPLADYKGDDVIVRKRGHDTWTFSENFGNMGQNYGFGEGFRAFSIDSNKALLGVTTGKVEKGVEIHSVSKESGASKAGLKQGDIITSIGDKKIESPDQLTTTIRSHKPGDKINITYLRDNKEQKTTAELGRVKGATVYSTTPGQFKYDIGDLNMDHVMPKFDQSFPRTRSYDALAQGYAGRPRLGLSVQDTDDGKGVKIIEVDDESNAAKAGLHEDDVITEIEGKKVNSADEVAKIIKESKDKTSVMIKLLRGGKTHNIEVKIPRKLKTADL